MRVIAFHSILVTTAAFLVSAIENSAFEVGNALADDNMLRGLITNPRWIGYASIVITQIGIFSLISSLIYSMFALLLGVLYGFDLSRHSAVVGFAYHAVGVVFLFLQGIVETLKNSLNLVDPMGTTQIVGGPNDYISYGGPEAASILAYGLVTQVITTCTLIPTMWSLYRRMEDAHRLIRNGNHSVRFTERAHDEGHNARKNIRSARYA